MDQNTRKPDITVKGPVVMEITDKVTAFLAGKKGKDGSIQPALIVRNDEDSSGIVLDFRDPKQMASMLYAMANAAIDLHDQVTGKDFFAEIEARQADATEEEIQAEQSADLDAFLAAMQEQDAKVH